jgi:hypothetical protein
MLRNRIGEMKFMLTFCIKTGNSMKPLRGSPEMALLSNRMNMPKKAIRILIFVLCKFPPFIRHKTISRKQRLTDYLDCSGRTEFGRSMKFPCTRLERLTRSIRFRVGH